MIEIENLKVKDHGALKAQFDLVTEVLIEEFPRPIKLQLRELKYFVKGDNEWINMPSRSWKEGEGWAYMDLAKLPEKEDKEMFRKAVIEKLKECMDSEEEKPEAQEDVPF